MPAGNDSYSQAVLADGPVGWYRFAELLAGSPVTAGGQDPQNLCMDASSTGYRNSLAYPNPNGNYLQYGSAVVSNAPSLLATQAGSRDGGCAVFPNTATKALANIVAGSSSASASGSFTITGTPTSANNNTYTIGGTAVNSAQTTGNTIAQQATADAAAINANATVNKLVVAAATATGVTVTAVAPGALGNGITTTATGGAGDVVTANQAALSGGSGNGSVIPTVLQPTTAISVAAWHRPAVINGTTKQVVACFGSDASALAPYALYHTGGSATTHVFNFSLNIGGTLRTATATTNLVAGVIYYVVGTYDGITMRIYVNGVQQGTTTISGAVSYANAAGLGLAFGNDPSLTDDNIQGALDEIAIYNKALTAARIAYHYRQGSAYLPFVWNH